MSVSVELNEEITSDEIYSILSNRPPLSSQANQESYACATGPVPKGIGEDPSLQRRYRDFFDQSEGQYSGDIVVARYWAIEEPSGNIREGKTADRVPINLDVDFDNLSGLSPLIKSDYNGASPNPLFRMEYKAENLESMVDKIEGLGVVDFGYGEHQIGLNENNGEWEVTQMKRYSGPFDFERDRIPVKSQFLEFIEETVGNSEDISMGNNLEPIQ